MRARTNESETRIPFSSRSPLLIVSFAHARRRFAPKRNARILIRPRISNFVTPPSQTRRTTL